MYLFGHSISNSEHNVIDKKIESENLKENALMGSSFLPIKFISPLSHRFRDFHCFMFGSRDILPIFNHLFGYLGTTVGFLGCLRAA